MKFKDLTESSHKCPHCGGPLFSEMMMTEKKDACYYKVKANAKVWPSAYASGRLVQCRKKGAANYGNKSKNEGVAEGQQMGEYGRVLSALGLYVPNRFSMEELNTPDWHRVIANKANVPVEYAGKVIDDFTRPVDGHDDDEWPEDDDENVTEGDGMYGDEEVSWEKGGRRAPTGAFRNPAAEKIAQGKKGSQDLPQWKKDWYAKQKPNSWPKHPQPYHNPRWIDELSPEERKKLTGKKGVANGGKKSQGVSEGVNGTQTILSLLKDFVKTREEPEDRKIIAGIYKAFQQGMEPGFTALYNAWEFDIDADFYYFAKNKGVDLHAVADQAGFDTDSIREGINEMNRNQQPVTAHQVYLYMIQQAPDFMKHAPTEDVKKAILKALTFGSQISVEDLASYAYGMLKSKSIDEDYNPEYDDEAGMADNNLETLKRAVEGIDDLIQSGDNLPEWCQEKIANAKSMLVAVWDYMYSEEASDEVDPEVDEMFEAMQQLVSEMAQKNCVSEDLVWESFEALPDNVLYETAAWRRKEGKSKKGGLNAKGVASYRRENPGSKLQMAVTTKPSKLKPGSKAAKRRKSFCARMSGVKGPMKKPNGKPTRKALALRKWNC